MSQLERAARERHRVLLVEDDPHVTRVTTRILEQDGYDVVVTSTADQALAVLERDSGLDCAMIDLELGAVSGLIVVEWLRAMRPRINVIIASGQNVRDLPAKAAFLSKPYSVEQLQQAVKKACTEGSEFDPPPDTGLPD